MFTLYPFFFSCPVLLPETCHQTDGSEHDITQNLSHLFEFNNTIAVLASLSLSIPDLANISWDVLAQIMHSYKPPQWQKKQKCMIWFLFCFWLQFCTFKCDLSAICCHTGKLMHTKQKYYIQLDVWWQAEQYKPQKCYVTWHIFYSVEIHPKTWPSLS